MSTFRHSDRIAFDNGETYFEGKIVFFQDDDTFNVRLDPEFAEFDGQHLNRVNPDYCTVIDNQGEV